jgi:hypothetical protein
MLCEIFEFFFPATKLYSQVEEVAMDNNDNNNPVVSAELLFNSRRRKRGL